MVGASGTRDWWDQYFTLQPMKMEPIEGSETSAIINQTPGNYPKGNLLYSVHGESLKSRKLSRCLYIFHFETVTNNFNNVVIFSENRTIGRVQISVLRRLFLVCYFVFHICGTLILRGGYSSI